MRNADRALIVDLHFDNGSYVGEEAAVNGDTHAAPLARFLLSPVRFLGGELRDAAQTANVVRIFLTHSRRPLRTHIQRAGRPEQHHQVIVRIAIRSVSEFIRE